MQDKPAPGDRVHMPSMGDDVRIEVTEVPAEQPLVATDGCYVVEDQYGGTHLVEADGGDWVTASADALSDEGTDIWLAMNGQVVPGLG